MYRFSSADRDYSSYTITDNKSGKTVQDEDFQPVKNKLLTLIYLITKMDRLQFATRLLEAAL